MDKIEKTVNNNEIKIYINSNLENTINYELGKYNDNVSFIIKNLKKNYKEKLQRINSNKIYMNDGEKIKSNLYFNNIIKKLLSMGIERDGVISYFGGGTLGDLIGYVSSVYKRGIDLIAVPTTLLSQVDSSIGGKNAINFMDVKNVVGSFHNPKIIFDDIDFLLNSDINLLKDGMAEVIKMALICDGQFFEYLDNNDLNTMYNPEALKNIIYKSVNLKLDIVSKDFYDLKKLRYLLNFGHSIGHAIESYTDNKIPHGVAVANGMIVESYIAYKSGYSKKLYDIIKNTVTKYKIDLINFNTVEVEKLISYMKNDKKMEKNVLNMVMLNDIGKSDIMKIDLNSIRRYLKLYMDERK